MRKLTNNLLEDITKRLAESIHPDMIYLFGSHATGNADRDSDIDLLAVVPDTDRSIREITLDGRSSLWGMDIPFDLIVCTQYQFNRFRNVKNTIMNEVLYEGKLVYGS